jgi:hypothetical protein
MPEYGDDLLFLPALTVVERDPEWSGLYDDRGRRLAKQRERIGFDLRSESVREPEQR